MLSEERKGKLLKQGYRVVENHSAVKACEWCKKGLVEKGLCYKGKFYGIRSWRCVQMTPALDSCNLRCSWCWRDISLAGKKFSGKPDPPAKIIDGCIEGQKNLLNGFPGFMGTNMQRFREAMKPLHFAISLEGEPCFYPKLPQLVEEVNARGMTSFVVSNGTVPAMTKKLLKRQPTQMYITLPAPNEEIFRGSCAPLEKGLWKNILKSTKMLEKFERGTLRLTVANGINLCEPEEYAALIETASPKFLEIKSYMFLGFSRKRLSMSNMPTFEDIFKFSKAISRNCSYELKDFSNASRVVLLARKDSRKQTPKIKFKKNGSPAIAKG